MAGDFVCFLTSFFALSLSLWSKGSMQEHVKNVLEVQSISPFSACVIGGQSTSLGSFLLKGNKQQSTQFHHSSSGTTSCDLGLCSCIHITLQNVLNFLQYKTILPIGMHYMATALRARGWPLTKSEVMPICPLMCKTKK